MRVIAYKNIIFTLAVIFACCWISPAFGTAGPANQQGYAGDQTPSIHVKNPLYNFGSITEGTADIEHEFTVRNTGKGVLKIERVQVGCGCTLVRFDQEIHPGAEGKVVMKLVLKNLQGKISKTATIHSNDPHKPEQVLTMEGDILAIITINPSTNILFRGMADQISESVLELNGTTVPFHITGVTSNLDENIKYSLETVSAEKHYRLRIANKTLQGNYAGFIKLNTDLEQKPDIIVRVSGFVEGEISVRPQNILIGKLIATQPERTAKVTVVSNRNKPFEIQRLIYDKELMSVSISDEQLRNQKGFILEVEPKLQSIPAGKRKQSVLEIETDLGRNEKAQVTVNVLNNSDQPEIPQHK